MISTPKKDLIVFYHKLKKMQKTSIKDRDLSDKLSNQIIQTKKKYKKKKDNSSFDSFKFIIILWVQ